MATTEAGGRDSAAPGPGQTLFAFVRHWSRRWHGPAGAELAERGREVLVVEAVHALSGRPPVTVNDVAAELAVDQSGASRLIAHAAERGSLAVTPAPADGRRRSVALTPDGEELLRAAHVWQEEVFAALTEGWTRAERTAFHRGMTRLLAGSARRGHGD
ncbi:MarR family transcriptional regulator [Streptomyces triticirhizae]|uniref:MarR family transcriptional regulator n=1 Tax=Streptomyces triticirhizae TaxID=2483353 RepID=A0A3M2L835_9ACTN|nr:MarR family transcriptional regulator [Streptomyces triticirhizae]